MWCELSRAGVAGRENRAGVAGREECGGEGGGPPPQI